MVVTHSIFGRLIKFILIVLTFTSSCRSHASSSDHQMDVLSPYLHHHGPKLKRHADTKACQLLKYGNLTHSKVLAHATQSFTLPLVESHYFLKKSGEYWNQRTTYVNHQIVQNPLLTLSVLEPGGSDGCRNGSGTMETVKNTGETKQCLLAVNAGFFDTKTGECKGNVISDGFLVQDDGGIQNAHFGLTSDGFIYTGFLSEFDLVYQKFYQLVGGVLWLVRDGEKYVDESAKVECPDTEETGAFERFINVVSARTAIGHDRKGRVHLVQVEGKTDDMGMNLHDFADMLIELGLVNAVNLDGGGSATTVINGTLRNYPSDQCSENSLYNCAREVSTVLCVHAPTCSPTDCSGHGTCDMGKCRCTGMWSGKGCKYLKCPADCSGLGTCTEDGCHCKPGWTGVDCSQECPVGHYGQNCSLPCACGNDASCSPTDGACHCPPGFTGKYCQHTCPFGYFGVKCEQLCFCNSSCYCDPVTGDCTAKIPNNDYLKAGRCIARQRIKDLRLVPAETQQLSFCISTVSVLAIVTVASLLLNVALTFLLTRQRRIHDEESAQKAKRAVKKLLKRLRLEKSDSSNESNTKEDEQKKLIPIEQLDSSADLSDEDKLFVKPKDSNEL